MTTGLITGFNAVSDLTTVVNGSAKTANEEVNSFSDMLKSNSEKQNNSPEVKNTSKPKDAEGSVKNQKEDIKEETVKTEKESETKTERAVSEEEVQEPEEVSDDVLAAAAQLVEIVAEILEVNPQEVAEALDNLELTDVALLDTKNIPKVVVEITEAEDTMAIMTDEDLYADVKEITSQIGDALTKLESESGLTAEQIGEEVSKFSVKEEADEPEIKEMRVQNDQAEEVTAEVRPQTVEIKTGNKREQGDNNHQNGQMSWNESFVENLKAVTTTQTDEVAGSYSTTMDDIYEQVSESLKLNLSDEVTEMEMNLHPASLGNVKVQIAARDGVITANFTTQNETVKAALETQIIQLKSNMAEQGIKVEAIEVTVASHAFDENLSKEGESNGGEQQTTKKRRIINLNEMAEDDDIIIDDAEAIARDMMIKNGTTVDYMA